MSFWIEVRPYITIGNILAMITGIGSVLTACILLYFKLRNLWIDQQIKTVAKVQELLNAQTKQIEHCVHQVPGHPENKTDSGIILPS